MVADRVRLQSLDIQYTVGMATNVPTTFFTVGSDNGGDLGGFLDLVNTLIAQETAPTVLTTSFGFPEALISQDFATYVLTVSIARRFSLVDAIRC